METIYFLVFVGICAFAVVWVARRPRAKTHLGKKHGSSHTDRSSEKLIPTTRDVLSSREEVWAARKKQTGQDFSAPKRFVPRSEASAEPLYDGYSRRDRHHVTPKGRIAEEENAKVRQKTTSTGIKSGSSAHATQT